MKTIFLFSLFTILSTLSFAQSGWQLLPSSYTSNLNDIILANDSVATCVGGSSTLGNILTTSDGGSTWATQTVGTSELNAIAGTTAAAWVVGNGGSIYKTINGTTWTSQISGVTTDLNDVQFPAATTGYAVGDSGVILKTANGISWTNPVMSGGTTYTINAVAFAGISDGVVAGDYNYIQGFFSRTVSGATYFGAPTTSISKINSVYFTSSAIGYAAAESGNIFKTTNFGTSWLPLSTGTTNINSIHFSDANNGYAVGDGGLILRTIDAGTTWTSQNSPTTQNLNSVYCNSTNTAYAVGENGTIIKTTSAGAYLSLSMNDDTIHCSESATIIANPSYTAGGTLSYTWTTNGPTPALINGNTLETGAITQTYEYYCTVTDGTLSSTDTMLMVVAALQTDSICLVTVDDSLGYNVVVFEKYIQGAIDYYKIYAETSISNIYDSIGFIPADSVGIFVDTNSIPEVKSYSYKISIVDSCGYESELSGKHKTMHLTINQGAGSSWNLLWNFYEGIPVQTYRIWRADPTMNWVKIDSVGGLNNSFTDINPPAGALYYQVEIISPYICQPYSNSKVNTNYNSSRSNTANNGITPVSLAADFDADITNGINPLTVQFNDLSEGGPSSYIWNFGDGNTSTDSDPSHTYTAIGLYSVKLVVSDGTTYDSITKTDYIDVLIDGINPNYKSSIAIYPNPINIGESLSISHKNTTLKNIEIFNILGKSIPFKAIDKGTKTDLLLLRAAKGIYFISIIDNYGDKIQRKFVVK